MARLLSVCSGEQSQRELMAHLGLQHRQHFTTAYLHPALATGYLARTIPDKPCSSRQRYCLTAKGQACKNLLISLHNLLTLETGMLIVN